MSHVKAGGTTKNLRDSNPKYLGVKLADGQTAQKGSIVVRQRGTKFIPGKNTKIGKDDTIFSIADGIVKFSNKRKKHFNGKTKIHKLVTVEEVKAKAPKKEKVAA
jgi:large subunit ribosomal protein L27